MENGFFREYTIDHIEIYTPMAKALAYWHARALGFSVTAYADHETGSFGSTSFVLTSGNIRLVLTSAYPSSQPANEEITTFIARNYCGVKRIALQTDDVKLLFAKSVANGAIPLKFPVAVEDEHGIIEEAAIKLYDHSEITFINRSAYKGVFKPGYKARFPDVSQSASLLSEVDHIASEVRSNEINYWTSYLTAAIGTQLVQSIQRGEENRTGMILNINQSSDKKLTLVMAEPDTHTRPSKVQQNIDRFGPGIHHLAFATDDIVAAIKAFTAEGVEFVSFPPSYYDLLRSNKEFEDMDIDQLQQNGILIDKEDDTYLLQKFIKPISDRPFFLYEIVQRVNGYNGFALKNINVLKKAEELQIMQAGS
jgi:4-hydroxyphenylpyruvate dioxygenase